MKIVTTSPVKHDGEDIDVGTTLDIPDRQANALIEAGAAEIPTKKAKADKEEDK